MDISKTGDLPPTSVSHSNKLKLIFQIPIKSLDVLLRLFSAVPRVLEKVHNDGWIESSIFFFIVFFALCDFPLEPLFILEDQS